MSYANVFKDLSTPRANASAHDPRVGGDNRFDRWAAQHKRPANPAAPGLYDHPHDRPQPTAKHTASMRAAWRAVVLTAFGQRPALGAIAHESCARGWREVVHVDPPSTQCDFFDCLIEAAMLMAHMGDCVPQNGVLLDCDSLTIAGEIQLALLIVDTRGGILNLAQELERGPVLDMHARVRELLPNLPDLSPMEG